MTELSPEFLGLQAALAGEYSLQRELGRGGMGVVYLARDVQLDRDVAIKVLPAHLASEPQHRARFLREARMAAGLSHPHIVPIHRVSEAGGYVFFVMSYIEGETLGERLRRAGPMPAQEVTRVLREVSWALAYAHGRGIVHRDVKPDNILLEAATGRALVTDFGIAFGGADPLVATDRGKVMGTAHFISPEQAAGGDVDGRSDIYALGVVGYLAVSGKLPFEDATGESRNLHAIMLRQATEQPQSVMRASPGLPPALGAAIDKCLARDPGQRFTDGEALAEALAPQLDARPALPPSLRAWLAAGNPLVVPFLGWSAGFSALMLGNLYANFINNPGSSPGDVALLAALAVAPIFPIVGFHLNQARLQFRAGHSLSDLRSALAISRKEQAETEAAAPKDQEQSGALRLLRNVTVASGTWLAVTFGLFANGIIHENVAGIWWLLAPLGTTMALGAVSNALDIQFIPDPVRRSWRTGIRDRIWNSRLGDWFARRLGAPERSKLPGASSFRATEAALGVAAGELYAALPQAYKEQLSELPNIVALLEARASEARAEMDVVAAMAPAAVDAEILAARRQKASKQLAESVAALEGIRLDLLKVHAGAGDLAPLTTLLDAAKVIGEDLGRLAEGQREVDRSITDSRSG